MASDADAGADALQPALRVIRILEDLGAPAWIGGSLASSIFGIPRATQDPDIVADLRAEMVRPFIERLGEHFYADSERIREGVERRSSFNLIYLPTMFKVDVFVLGHDARSQRELEQRRHIEIGEGRVPVTSPEDIVVRKLAWYRDGGSVSDRQWLDALGVARARPTRLGLPEWGGRRAGGYRSPERAACGGGDSAQRLTKIDLSGPRAIAVHHEIRTRRPGCSVGRQPACVEGD